MNLPNKITIARIVMIPFFIVAVLIDFPYHEYVATLIFVVASLSDMVDGYLARSRNLVTDFGKFMDPLADKLLVCSALICLVEVHLVYSWVVIIIIAREFAVTGLRTLAASDGIVIAASKWGKAKTISQMIAITLLLLYPIPYFQLVGTVIMYIALVLTIISGVDYFRLNTKVFKTM
jgi:CDP-diacylglycerol--glycerol-3-phosphate 3-phosphatidyltransferase